MVLSVARSESGAVGLKSPCALANEMPLQTGGQCNACAHQLVALHTGKLGCVAYLGAEALSDTCMYAHAGEMSVVWLAQLSRKASVVDPLVSCACSFASTPASVVAFTCEHVSSK